MPDVHTGKGCVIGFTADLGDKVIPNIVGVDIGCGILCVKLGKEEIDLKEIDSIVNKYIPAGMNIRNNPVETLEDIKNLNCFNDLKEKERFNCSIVTLGGGNHFIEIDEDRDNNKYLVIHTGSRNLGSQVAEYYQKLAIELCHGKEDFGKKREEIIELYKKQGRQSEIQVALSELQLEYENRKSELPNDLCYLSGEYREKYLHDMKICQNYAKINRLTIAKEIVEHYFRDKKINDFERFETIHNYISFEDNIVRKGAISAKKGEKVIIPMNMRDGSIIAIGRGNADWNNSAPHGAGRLMSRNKAKEMFTMQEFKESMKNIYTTSLAEETIDEAPFVYKPMQEILDNIKDTCEIEMIIKPIYNFKAKS